MESEAHKNSKYEDILKRPSHNANAIGRRPPWYLNYTKEGLLKDKPAAVVKKREGDKGGKSK